MEDLTDFDNHHGDADSLHQRLQPLKKNVKARTKKQMEERAKWTIALLFTIRFKTAIKAGFKNQKTGVGGAKMVLRHLLKYAVPDALFGGEICYKNVILSSGKLRNIRSFTGRLNLEGLLTINWVNSKIGRDDEEPERLYLSLYNQSKDLVHCIEQPICQQDLQTALQLPFYQKYNQYHLWIFEVTAANSNAGNTFYIKL